MNADVAFTIGKTHRICQDYARAAKDGGYILLADGCSSSPDSDFGSRLLIKCAEDNLINPEVAVRDAAAATRVLKLKEESLDSTLLITRVAFTQGVDPEGKLTAYIAAAAYGDGYIVAEHRNGYIEAYQLEYRSGYPQYLSYTLDKDRQARLSQVTNGNDLTITRWLMQKDGTFEKDDPERKPAGVFQIDFKIEEYATIALFSDGVGTFTDASLNIIPWQNIVREMMDFGPARKGEFVQRQMNWMLKELAKRKWTHADDFSMAAMNLL